MVKKVNIIPHTHWDREWYFTAQESKLLLLNDLHEIMDKLENDPNYPYFILDGQTAIIEDYLALNPSGFERMKELVQKGKLIIGPWYTQTDEMVVGGESIVRNLLYGMKDCLPFGEPMMLGYLPDSFGQSSQMPMIFNGFNIERSVFWRGTSERIGTSKTEFYWESDDGSSVLTQVLPLGYSIAKYLPQESSKLKERFDKYFPVLERGASGDQIIIMNGHDQMPIQQDIHEVIKGLEEAYPDKQFVLSNFENHFEQLEKQSDFDVIKGEFLDGKYQRVHRSIFSSRADIKTLNTIIENKLSNILEPLSCIAHSVGFDYYSGLIESIYKEVLKNHAHDSIGCCCSDKVHNEVYNRFVYSLEQIEQTIEYYKRKIADAIQIEKGIEKVVAFNLLPYDRKGVFTTSVITKLKNFQLVDEAGNTIDFSVLNKEEVDAGFVDRQIVHYGDYDPFVRYDIQLEDLVPSMGYKTYFIKELKESLEIQKTTVSFMENEFMKVEIAENGTCKIYDKIRNQQYRDVFLVEDGSDDGDGYDYSPMIDDYIVTSKDCIASIEISSYGHCQEAIISYEMAVPKDLMSRKQKLLDSSIYVKLQLSLNKDDRYLNIKYTIHNNACDHRVRFLVPTNILSTTSVSDNQFGIITRSIKDDALDYWHKEGWDERPDGIYPMLSYVSTDHDPVTIITNSVREYEIINEEKSTIAITLYRCTGYLGKDNLVRRPGRPSGIMLPTPDQQLLKEMTFELAILFNEDKDQLAKLAKQYLTPIQTYNKKTHNAMKMNNVSFTVPTQYTFFQESNENIVMSVLKKAEQSDAYIYRVFNTTSSIQESKINKNIISIVNLNEDDVEENNTIYKNQVKTYKIK